MLKNFRGHLKEGGLNKGRVLNGGFTVSSENIL